MAARRARFDALIGQIEPAARRKLRESGRELDQLSRRLRRAIETRAALDKRRLQNETIKLRALEVRMQRALASSQNARGARLASLGQLLDSLSYRKVLERGYVVVKDAKGQPLTRAAAVAPGSHLSLTFADDVVSATAAGDAPPKPARGAKPSATQGDLF